jgi:uncharacterized membrane protein
MEKSGLGQILALVGLILFVLTGVGRQRSRSRSQASPPSPTFQLWQKYGTIAAIALVVVGLILVAMAK